MKIIKTKTYKKMLDQIDRITKQVLKQQHELRNLQDTNRELGNSVQVFTEKLIDKDKEIKKLKSLLTKNKIDYKHLYKTKED